MADRLGVRLLGDFRVDGAELETLRSRQARTLLKRLALERGGTVVGRQPGRGGLAERAAGPARPRPARAGQPGPRRSWAATGCVRRDGGYALLADWWDVAELAALAREATRRADAGDPVGARTAAEGALALVRGPLLADEPDAEWAAEARAAADASVAEARRVAAAARPWPPGRWATPRRTRPRRCAATRTTRPRCAP